MEKQYIYQTNYFGNTWTWVGRAISFLVAAAVLFLVDLNELKAGNQFLLYGYFLVAALVIVMLALPTDELALDNEMLYFERKSLFPAFNQVVHYKISDLKGIGTYSIGGSSGIFSLLLPVWSVNRIEIIFNDDSSCSRDVITNKKELKKILLKVRGLMADKNAN
jgi:hypothetical protein